MLFLLDSVGYKMGWWHIWWEVGASLSPEGKGRRMWGPLTGVVAPGRRYHSMEEYIPQTFFSPSSLLPETSMAQKLGESCVFSCISLYLNQCLGSGP